ncbi:hypothetical protein [Catenulispora rubra]|uniref:hypothetical protein n=1 Tax=Catenulispora rubra TaxID=280293 RepID=UPI0018922B04|nr:hypothetical protein [Catenulispora rubra]
MSLLAPDASMLSATVAPLTMAGTRPDQRLSSIPIPPTPGNIGQTATKRISQTGSGSRTSAVMTAKPGATLTSQVL